MKLRFRSLFTSTNEEDCIPLPVYKSIESLFEQEDTLFRCKQLTDSHLLAFLSKNVSILTLLDYVTLMVKGGITPSILPPQALDELRQKVTNSGFGSFCNTSGTPDSPSSSSDEKAQEEERFRQFLNDRLQNKYPYMATEMICSIIGKYHILPRIVEDEVLLSKFLIVLNYPKEEIVRNSAKQYMRILGNISMNADFHYNLFSYFYKQDGLPLLNLLKFSDYASDKVSEILKAALLFNPSSFRKSSTNLHKLTNDSIQETKMGIVQQMIRSMTSDFNLEVVKTAVIELLGTERPSDLIDCIIKKDSFSVITSTLFQNANDSSIVDAIMEIIRKILFISRHGDEVVDELFALIEKFANILVNPSDYIQPLQLSTGDVAVPFGLFRLSIIEFFKFLFENLDTICEKNSCKATKVENGAEEGGEDKAEETTSSKYSGESYADLLKRLDIVNTFIKLFYSYPNNNIMHYQITYILLHILSAKPNTPTYQFIEPLVKGENSIIPKIISEVMESKSADSKKTPPKAYIGHLTQIGYAISDLEIDEDEMEEMYSGWSDFYKYLKDRHFVETVYCHGGDITLPQHMIDWEDDSDDEFGIHDASDEFEDEFDNDDIESKMSRLNLQEDDEFMESSTSSVDHPSEEDHPESSSLGDDGEERDASEKQEDYDWYLDSNENE